MMAHSRHSTVSRVNLIFAIVRGKNRSSVVAVDGIVTGSKACGEANGKIFAAVPNIKIDVDKLHLSPETNTAVCECTVNVNDEGKTTLKVVDIIEFNADGKIKALRASSYFAPPS